MGPRRARKQGWLDRFSALTKPETIVLLMTVGATYLDGRRNVAKVEESGEGGRRALWHHVAQVELSRDSLRFRVESLEGYAKGLERRLKHLGRAAGRLPSATSSDTLPVLGPLWGGPPRGTLLKSLRGLFGRLLGG